MSKKCAYEDCGEEAVVLACGRDYSDIRPGTYHPEPAYYCVKHGKLVVEEGSPEYYETCPNCACKFGVN